MKRPEEALQKSICAFLACSMQPPWIFWHTPNQRGTRAKWENALLKALGVKPGIPDLFVLGPGPTLVGLECKSPRGVLTPAQKDVMGVMAELGVPTIVVRDLDDAIAALSTLGVKFKGRVM